MADNQSPPGFAFLPVAPPLVPSYYGLKVGTWADSPRSNVVEAFFDRRGHLHFRVTDLNELSVHVPLGGNEDPACTMLAVNFWPPFAGLAPDELCTVIHEHLCESYALYREQCDARPSRLGR